MSKNQKLFETRRSSVPFAIYAFVYDRKSNIFFSFWHNNCSRVFATTAISPSTLLTGVLLLTNLVSLISLNPVLFRLSVASLNLLSVPFRMISARSPFLRSPSCPSRHVPKLFLLVQNLLSSQLPSSRADLFFPSPISVRGSSNYWPPDDSRHSVLGSCSIRLVKVHTSHLYVGIDLITVTM